MLHELGGLEIPPLSGATPQQSAFSLQNWLINITALCINQAVLPPVESIHYALSEASPPLWCYIELALDRLHPTQRLIIVMAQTFRWSETRIAAYLQAEGERVTPAQVRSRLRRAHQELEAALPADIQEIYLAAESNSIPVSAPTFTAAETADLMSAL